VQLLHPEQRRAAWVHYVVIGISLVFEGATWRFAVAEFSGTKGKWSYLEAVRHGKGMCTSSGRWRTSQWSCGRKVRIANANRRRR
jgi:hypothetical protein